MTTPHIGQRVIVAIGDGRLTTPPTPNGLRTIGDVLSFHFADDSNPEVLSTVSLRAWDSHATAGVYWYPSEPADLQPGVNYCWPVR